MMNELDSVYMVEANDGCAYHYGAYDLGEVRDQFEKNHPDLKIKTIYLEVYVGEEDEQI
jgi:hypothetical protein